MKRILILLAALEIAVTVCTVRAQETGSREDRAKAANPTASLVVTKIIEEEAGIDTRHNNLVTALYVSGTFTNTNPLPINLHSFHVIGLDGNGEQVANSECDKSEGQFTGSLASGETANFKAELIDAKREIRILKVELN